MSDLLYIDVPHKGGLFGLGAVDGVIRHFVDGTSIFVSNADLASEKLDAEIAAKLEADRLAELAREGELRAEGADAQFELTMQALDQEFPALRKEVNEKAKALEISKREALNRILAAQATIASADESLANLRALGYKGRRRK